MSEDRATIGRCPDDAALDALVDGIAASAEAARLSEHVTACAACAERLARARADAALVADVRAALGAGAVPQVDATWPRCPGFRLERVLGQGGAGVVYEATQEHPRRRVAIKVIAAGRGARPLDVERFRREIDVLGTLEHPSIASVHCSGSTSDGSLFMAMERIDGRDLGAFARERPAWSVLAPVLQRLCDAVAAAHARGVVHRDLKPGNVLVTNEGGVKLIDFGLAALGDRRALPLTSTGELRGTPAYMSPERFRSRPVDERADVYALGLMAWEALAGRHPYAEHAHDWVVLARAMAESEPPPLRSVRPDVPEHVSLAIAAATSIDPAARPTAHALARAFADERGLQRRVHVGAGRRRALAALGAMIAIVAATFAALSSRAAPTTARTSGAPLAVRYLAANVIRPSGVSPADACSTAQAEYDEGRSNGIPLPARRFLLCRLALHLESVGRYDEAIERLREAASIQAAPRLSVADAAVSDVRIARCQLLKGDVGAARATLASLDANPRLANALTQSHLSLERAALEGDLLRVAGDVAESEELLTAALARAEVCVRDGGARLDAGGGRWLVARVLESLERTAIAAHDERLAQECARKLAALSSLPGPPPTARPGRAAR